MLALAQLAGAQVVPPTPIYILSETNTLATATLSAPGATSTPLPITGIAANETLVGIDVRPQNSALYGVGVDAVAETVQIYHISTQTGLAVAVGTPFSYTTDGVTLVDLPAAGWDIDFNPAVDRLRLVAGSLNLRANPNNGTPVDGGMALGNNPDGSFNGASTVASATAYTNSQPNNGNITTQYTLDAATNALYIQNPPNNGTLGSGLTITVNGSTLDFTSVSGFDIEPGVNAAASASPVASGVGYAVLKTVSTSKLYQLDLTTGAATEIADFAPRSFALRHRLPISIGLNDTGTSLVRFSPLTPGTATSVALTGITSGETIVGIDMRPATGQFYVLGIDSMLNKGSLYLLDPQGGALTVVGGVAGAIAFVDALGDPVPLPASSVGYDIDFNPTVDRLRVVSGSGLNFRVNPLTGGAVDGNTGVTGTNTDGSINGAATGVNGTAYTNSFGGTTFTTQYTLDAATNSLFIQNPPNNGTQTNGLLVAVNGSALDFTAPLGFDILGSVAVATSNAAATGDGFFVSTVGGTSNLYRLDLATATATSLGALGTPLSSFAILSIPTAATVNTPTVSNLTPTSATLGGNVPDDGGTPITQRGIVLAPTSVSTLPSIGGTGVTLLPASGTTGVFTVPAGMLTTSTNYSFRAFATSALGTAYSAVRTFVPPILVQPTFPAGMVSQEYSATLNFAPGTTFVSSLLPAGLKLNAKTGVISGRLTTPGAYAFTITAKGTNGTTLTYTSTLVVQALPRTSVGAFVGLILPSTNLNGNAGGRMDLTITNKGSYTLKVTQRTKSYTVSGYLVSSVGSNPTLTASLTGGITVNLTLLPNDTVTGTLTLGVDMIGINGWRKIYDKVFYPANPEMGYYSVGIRRTAINVGNVIVPQGSGFAAVTIGEDGSTKFVGQSADGMPLTSTGFMGPNGEILVHAQTYAKLGAVFGILGQTNDPGENYTENSISGSLYLTKPPTTGRTYTTALNSVELETAGKYLAFAGTGSVVLGLPSTDDPSTLDFSDGGIDLASINPDLNNGVNLLVPSLKFTVPVAGSAQNPGRVTLTLSAASGAVSGSFKLNDGGGRNAVYKFQGMIIRRADGSTTANGYFLLPQIPVGMQTPANSPILSGNVDLIP
ncbi:MAG: DUF4394 domain-containing protein [Verrucomicrobiota bacterium]